VTETGDNSIFAGAAIRVVSIVKSEMEASGMVVKAGDGWS